MLSPISALILVFSLKASCLVFLVVHINVQSLIFKAIEELERYQTVEFIVYTLENQVQSLTSSHWE